MEISEEHRMQIIELMTLCELHDLYIGDKMEFIERNMKLKRKIWYNKSEER